MKPDIILGLFNFAVSDRDWIKERVKVIEVVDKVLDTSLGSLVKWAGVHGSAKKAESRKAFHDLIATGKSEVFVLFPNKKVLSVSLVLTITPMALGVDVRVHDAELEARRATVIDDVVAVAAAVRSCGGIAGLKYGYVSPLVNSKASFPRPRPRPPRRPDTISVAAIHETNDQTFHRSEHPDAAEGARLLASAELPAPARRTEHDGLMLVRWAEDFSDVAALERGAAAHEDWIGRHLPTTIEGGYNELGDLAEPMQGLEARPPLTMYAPQSRTGYVAVVIDEQGAPEDHYFRLAKDLAARRALPDGAAVERVRIVVPLRELAIDFAGEARRQGIDAVLYPADDGTWWNPDPPGDWAYPPKRDPARRS
jgi:hypothetical protein